MTYILLCMKTGFFPEFCPHVLCWRQTACIVICGLLNLYEATSASETHVSVGSTSALKAFVTPDGTWALADTFHMEVGGRAGGEGTREESFAWLPFVVTCGVGALQLPPCQHHTVSLPWREPCLSVSMALRFLPASVLVSVWVTLLPSSPVTAALLWEVKLGFLSLCFVLLLSLLTLRKTTFPFVITGLFRSHKECASTSENITKNM